MADIRIENIKKLKLFKDIKEESVNELIKVGMKRSCKKGELIFSDRECIDKVFIVLNGKFSLYKIGEEGQKRVLYILGEERIFNEDILNYEQASMYCEAFEDGELLVFSKIDFIKIMEKDFQLTKAILNSLAVKVRRLSRQLKNTNPNKKIEKKIAAKLWKLSKDYGIMTSEGVEIGLNISITYLADMFGSQRETVSRALKILEKEGHIKLINKKIVVKDREKLLKYFKGL